MATQFSQAFKGTQYHLSLKTTVLPLGGAVALTLSVLAAALRFDLSTFLTVFLKHKEMRAGGFNLDGIRGNLRILQHVFGIGRNWVVLGSVLTASVVFTTAVAVENNLQSRTRRLVWGLWASVVCCSLLYAASGSVVAPNLLLMISVVCLAGLPASYRRPSQFLCVGLIAVFNSHRCWQIVLENREAIELGSVSELPGQANDSHHGKLFVDGSVYRSVFKFQPPADTECVMYGAAHPESRSPHKSPVAGETWVIGEETAVHLGLYQPRDSDLASIGPYRSRSTLRYPNRVHQFSSHVPDR